MELAKYLLRPRRALGAVRISSRLSAEASWVFIAQLSGIAASLVGVRVLTEYLDPAVYGTVALVMSLAALLQQIFIAPTMQGARRFYPASLERNELRELEHVLVQSLTTAFRRSFVLVSIGVVLLSIFGQLEWIQLLLLCWLMSFTLGISSVFDGIHDTARRRKAVALHLTLREWGRQIIALILVLTIAPDSRLILIGFIIGGFLAVVMQQRYYLSLHDSRQLGVITSTQKLKSTLHQFRHYAGPFSIWGVFVWAQLASDRWALQMLASAETVGLYAVLFQLGVYPMKAITSMIFQFVQPVAYARAGVGDDRSRIVNGINIQNVSVVVILALAAVATLVATFFHERVFSLLAGAAYQSVSNLLPYMILAGGLFGAGQGLSTVAMTAMETQRLLIPKISMGVLALVANSLGAYYGGLNGVVYSAVFIGVAYFFLMFLVAKKMSSVGIAIASSKG